MSEEPTTVDTTREVVEGDVVEIADSANELSHEEALKELAKVRKEAAAKRVANKELVDKAAKYDEHLKSQLSETERLKAEVEELKAANDNLKTETVRERVALKYGIESEMAQLMFGDLSDEATLEARAKALSGNKVAEEDTKGKKASFGGRRGTPVKSQESEPTLQSVFTEMWNNVEGR